MRAEVHPGIGKNRMRIYDGKADQTLHHIYILVTREEIDDFIANLRGLRDDPIGGDRNVHELVHPLHDFVKEVQFCLYEEGSTPIDWHPRFSRIIESDE
jgi:hypothetical protein